MCRIKVSHIYFVVVMFIVTQGLWNYIFSKVGFSSWKQIIVLSLILFSFLTVKERKVRNELNFMLLISFSGVLYSLYIGEGLVSVIANALFYISWLPFYVISSRGHGVNFSIRLNYIVHVVGVLSVVGLLVDSQTSYFQFLSGKAIEYYDLVESLEIANRGSFIFVTSTSVLPTLCGLLAISSTTKILSSMELFLWGGIICLSIYSAASLSGAIFGFIFFIGMLLDQQRTSFMIIIIVVLCCISLSVFTVFNFSGHNVQLERILGNTVNSESNLYRVYLWKYAIEIITEFGPLEVFFGKGIGTTNSNFNPSKLFFHGESSYFQALIEFGLIGLFIRLTPIVAIFLLCKSYTVRFYSIAVLFATAVAPTWGNIGLQAILGTLLGISYSSRISHTKGWSYET